MHADKLADWFVKWNIAVNADRSEALLFQGRRRYRPQQNIIMDRHRIPKKKEMKYLAVIIDDKFTLK